MFETTGLCLMGETFPQASWSGTCSQQVHESIGREACLGSKVPNLAVQRNRKHPSAIGVAEDEDKNWAMLSQLVWSVGKYSAYWRLAIQDHGTC
jgi:hypothetical protein